MSKPKTTRPFTRCHGCGIKFPGARTQALCHPCLVGQNLLWPLPYAPDSFKPIPQG